MKKLLIFTFILFSAQSFGLSFESGWNPFFEKEVVVSCNEDEYFCDNLCDEKEKCVFKEKACRDCIGSSVYMTYIFNYAGKSIVRTEEEVPMEDLIIMLKSGLFSTIHAKSIYNHVERFDSPVLKEKFQRLCNPYVDEYPMLVYDVEKVSKKLGKPKYVVCNDPEGVRVFTVGLPADGVDSSLE